MGIFTVHIEIGDLDSTHFEEFDALAGSPSFLTVIPASALRRLGIEPYKREVFILPDGSEAEYDVGHVIVRVQGGRRLRRWSSSTKGSNHASGG